MINKQHRILKSYDLSCCLQRTAPSWWDTWGPKSELC